MTSVPLPSDPDQRSGTEGAAPPAVSWPNRTRGESEVLDPVAPSGGDTLTMPWHRNGVGITPMLGLAKEISREQGTGRRPSVVVLHRVHDIAAAPFVAEFDSLNRRNNVQVVRLIGPRGPASGWFPGPGRIDPVAALIALVPGVADREVYVCGPKPWAAAVRATLRSSGVPRRAVHLEDFAT